MNPCVKEFALGEPDTKITPAEEKAETRFQGQRASNLYPKAVSMPNDDADICSGVKEASRSLNPEWLVLGEIPFLAGASWPLHLC